MPEDIERLSERERTVVELMAAGKADKEIAAELSLSVNTVKGYGKSILLKLNVQSRTEAAVMWTKYQETRRQKSPPR
jgi:DNA-binding NarL/FixJ family response regulator